MAFGEHMAAFLDAAPRTQTTVTGQRWTLFHAWSVFFRSMTPFVLTLELALLVWWRLGLGAPTIWDGAVAFAVAVYWPFQEWFVHVVLLHFKPRTVFGVHIDPFASRVHRWHHRHPDVIERIFVPTRAIVALTPIHIALWWFTMPTPEFALTGMCTFTAAALTYEWFHFSAHAPYRPRLRYFRDVRRHHQMHHFKNEHYWHGFTVPYVDQLFGTSPDPARVEKSPTCRTLGVDEEP